MMAYSNMSYWDVYKLPIPFRKWYIQRYNKHVKEQNKNKTPDNEPLSKSERLKMIQQSQQVSNKPNNMAEKYLQPTRNRNA